ncbi:DNA-binding response regulator (plasmid) [Methylosinus sp. C49]|nr:response regulator transcription factor [Methylosinus sp. C49]BBU64020.1 DNA-binding response regulator [Methylosinus sp. C49]
MRILIVEDQPDIATLIGRNVSKSGFVADRVGTLTDASAAIRDNDYPLVLLDRRLPDGDGMSLIPEMKRMRPGVRIVIVSAARKIDERVSGLEAGADDYLTKPFAAKELIARIRACLRRPGGEQLPPIMIGALSVDPNSHEASIRGAPFIPPRRELILLEALARRAGRAVNYPVLIEEVYGSEDDSCLGALKMLVSRLRQRLNDKDAGLEIHAPKGIGYLIKEIRRD